MTKLLQDIWIIEDSGIVLFHRVFDEKVDATLFGGLLTALNSFAEEIASGGLSNFELAGKRFYILKKKNYLFIANASNKYNVKKVKIELDGVMQKFFELYSNILLNNWNGDTSLFSSFEYKIEDSLEGMIEKLEKAFW
ncbi:MAG: hypothetical protein R3255_08065 [Candidatus Lokiarchaeia archaeon]|nr:hypothetical protein [Candidatus Lokiarchaeia archaeon]